MQNARQRRQEASGTLPIGGNAVRQSFRFGRGQANLRKSLYSQPPFCLASLQSPYRFNLGCVIFQSQWHKSIRSHIMVGLLIGSDLEITLIKDVHWLSNVELL